MLTSNLGSSGATVKHSVRRSTWEGSNNCSSARQRGVRWTPAEASNLNTSFAELHFNVKRGMIQQADDLKNTYICNHMYGLGVRLPLLVKLSLSLKF